jgi:hypothetical protein
MHLSLPSRSTVIAVLAVAPLAAGPGLASASTTHSKPAAKHHRHSSTKKRSVKAASASVIHSVEVSDQTVQLANAAPGQQSVWHTTTRRERWLFEDRSHTILTYNGETYDQVLGDDGVLRNRLPSGEVQTVSAATGSEGASIVNAAKTDPVSAYRQEFASGDVQDAGLTTFAGRSAHAYQRTIVTALPDGKGSQTETETLYVDASGGAPLGVSSHIANPSTTIDDTTMLKVYERLPATEANLAHVAG